MNGAQIAYDALASGTIEVGNQNFDLRIGVGTSGSSYEISEVIIFKRGLKDSEREVVENYLSQKYSIKLN